MMGGISHRREIESPQHVLHDTLSIYFICLGVSYLLVHGIQDRLVRIGPNLSHCAQVDGLTPRLDMPCGANHSRLVFSEVRGTAFSSVPLHRIHQYHGLTLVQVPVT